MMKPLADVSGSSSLLLIWAISWLVLFSLFLFGTAPTHIKSQHKHM
jgi:hypothetical protein